MNKYTRNVFIQSYKNALLHARTGNEIQDIYNGMQTMAADFDAPVGDNVPKPQRGCDCDDCEAIRYDNEEPEEPEEPEGEDFMQGRDDFITMDQLVNAFISGRMVPNGEESKPDEDDQPLPDWATSFSNPPFIQVGMQLLTKDGRVTGNGAIFAMSCDYVHETVLHIITDAGNTLQLSESAMKDMFYPGDFIMSVYAGDPDGSIVKAYEY
jgi:hypothetical protein